MHVIFTARLLGQTGLSEATFDRKYPKKTINHVSETLIMGEAVMFGGPHQKAHSLLNFAKMSKKLLVTSVFAYVLKKSSKNRALKFLEIQIMSH